VSKNYSISFNFFPGSIFLVNIAVQHSVKVVEVAIVALFLSLSEKHSLLTIITLAGRFLFHIEIACSFIFLSCREFLL
jgi:hypothetical protein